MSRTDSSVRSRGRRTTGVLPAWSAPIGVGAAATLVGLGVALLDPDVRGAVSPGCPFRMLTGLDCPGCGGTRAFYALTRGDVLLALDHNLVTVVALPLLMLAWTAWLASSIGWRAGPLVLPPPVSYGVAVTFVTFFVVRNLPWLPFTWLASGAG